MANENQKGPTAHLLDDLGLETRTTAFESQPCEQCKRPLTGRKQRFCSDACRLRHRREQDRARLGELLHRLESDLHALREELVGEVEP